LAAILFMKLFATIFVFCFVVSASGQGFKTLKIDPAGEFEIDYEDSVYIDLDTLRIKADLRMPTKEDPSTVYEIRFTEATLIGDTLNVRINELNPAYYHMYQIQIVKNKYRVCYNFLSSGEPVDRKVKADDFKLVLNTGDIKKGKEIRGHTEYKGKCVKGCWPSHSVFDIKGDFKVVVK
jgi:hypothetical protein